MRRAIRFCGRRSGALRSALEQDGINKDTLRPGDHILITGSPGKTAGEHRIHLKTIERPSDGFRNEGMGRGGNRFRR